MWWEKGRDRRLFFTHGNSLIALNAADGKAVESFGDGGGLDLTPAVDRQGRIYVTVPGVVFEDKLIFGFSTNEDANAFSGSVRAFSAVDGSPVWQFDTIPAPGDAGSETWAEGSLEGAGGANVWTGMALDARTGELLWHFQVVRHDLWDKDNPSPPTLVQLERDGRTIDAVAITTKTGQLYVFDRETGESMYAIHEIETPIPSTLPGFTHLHHESPASTFLGWLAEQC